MPDKVVTGTKVVDGKEVDVYGTNPDIAPKEDTPKNRWLQLQNEGGKYVRTENGRIKLKIVK